MRSLMGLLLCGMVTSAQATEFQNVEVSQLGESIVVRADVVPPTPYNILHGYGVQLAFSPDAASGYPWFLRAPDVGSGQSNGFEVFSSGVRVGTLSAITEPDSFRVEIPIAMLNFPSRLDWLVRRTADTGDGFSDGVWQVASGSLQLSQEAPTAVKKTSWGALKRRWR